MSSEEPKPPSTGTQRSVELNPQAVAILKSQFGDDILDVLRVDEGILDLEFVHEKAKAEVTRRQEGMSFNQVALQRRVYENEIVKQDAEVFKELAILVRSIGERYRALTGLPPVQRG